MKGYLIYRGWNLERTHNLVRLIEEAVKHDKNLAVFLDLAGKLTGQYLEQRYPPGSWSEYSPEETAELLRQSEQLITQIEETTRL